MAHICCALFTVFVLLHFARTQSFKELEPVLVQIVFRHGDRSSVETYPTNPYTAADWPQGYGQLSQTGMKQHYDLGGYFRDRYMLGHPHKLLNATYERTEITVRSTDYDRTLMSAYSHLAGMYPPNGTQVWNPDIPWQPIPVHTEPLSIDHMIYVQSDCPVFDRSFNATLAGDFVKNEERTNKEFYQFVSNKTGFAEESVNTIWKVFDTLNCESRHSDLGFEQPPWASATFNEKTVFDKMGELESLQFTLKYTDALRSRLTGGTLVGFMSDNMRAKANGTLTEKYLIYSAHDTTVAAVMGGLQVFNEIFPPYTATVIVELLQNTTSLAYSVRLLFKNESNSEPYTLRVPGCTDLCPMDEFIRLTADAVPVDWASECGLAAPFLGQHEMMLIIIVCVVGALLVMTLIFVMAVWAKQQRQRKYHRYSALETST